jgi:hypothetical protein
MNELVGYGILEGKDRSEQKIGERIDGRGLRMGG